MYVSEIRVRVAHPAVRDNARSDINKFVIIISYFLFSLYPGYGTLRPIGRDSVATIGDDTHQTDASQEVGDRMKMYLMDIIAFYFSLAVFLTILLAWTPR